MDALALDPGDYRGTYKLIGGRLSLDFVNTVSWPDTARSHDWLATVGNVVMWLNAVGLKAESFNTPDLVAIAAARAALTAVLRPLAHGKRPTKNAIAQLNEYVAAANSSRVIAPTTLTWTWKPSKRSVDDFRPVLLDAAEIITGGRHHRLRYCPSCDWLFEDQTRNGQRRWCDMADCGSRDKAHRYYQRSK
jgi:predicted RNA-binding Zn ribbon-like protein